MPPEIRVVEINQGPRGPAGPAGLSSITSATTSDGTADLSLANVSTATATVSSLLTAPHIHGNIAGSVYAHVRAGEDLAKGDPVYVSGSHGSGSTLIAEVSKADASDPAKMPAVGIMDAAIDRHASGHMVITGNITELDTDDFAINATLYVAEGGGWTDERPTLAQPVARVERSNANNGAVIVKVNGILGVDSDGTGADPIPFREAIDAAAENFSDVSLRADRMLVIMTGQSLSVGNNGQPALSVSPLDPYSLTFTGGVKSTALEMTSFVPLDEDNDATAFGETAGEVGLAHVALRYNKQVLASYGVAAAESPAIVAVTVGRGSYDLAGLRKGDVSGTYDLLEDAIQNFESIATASSKTSEVLGVIFRQGESDNSTPTITRAQYATSLEGYLAEIEADAITATGQKRPVVMVSYQTSAGIIGVNGSNVGTLGQHDVLYRNENFTIASPVYPIYANGYLNTSDKVHSTNFGYGWLGAYEGRSLAKLAHGEKPWPLCPLSATARGQVIDVVYRVPSPPLVLDTTNVPSVADSGFAVVDDTGTLTILSVALLDDTTVRITVDRDLDANPVVRYALSADFSGSQVDRGCAGNLRDSDTETVSIAGRLHNLYNWAIHSETEIIVEGGVTRYYVLNTDASSYADRLDNYDATVIGSAPTFTSTYAVIQRSASLDTNIAPGAEFTAIVVWQHDTTQDTVLFGNFGPNLAAQNGAMLLLSGSSGVLRFYRKNVISTPSAPQVIIPTSRNGQWCVAAVAFKADEVIVYSPQSNEGLGRVTGSGFTIDSSPTMAIGGARYTQSHAGTCKIAAVMMSDQFLTTPEIDAHIEILRGDLAGLGITI